MNHVALEMRADFRYEIGMVLITTDQMIHFHLDDLLDVGLFNIVGGKVEDDAERSNNKDAERGKC